MVTQFQPGGRNSTPVPEERKTSTGTGVQRGPVEARWLLMSEELGISVRAPHEVRAVQHNINLNMTTFGALSDDERSSMMMPSDPQTLSVTAEWRARDNEDDIRPDAKALITLATKDKKRRRHPLVSIKWAHLSIDPGWVSSMVFDWVDGVFDSPPFLPQAFVVRLSVTRTRPRILERTSRFERFTKFRTLGGGETFESVAWTEYGDPDLGNVLRRNNPTIPLTGEASGDVIRIYDRDNSIIREADPLPQSPALGGDVRELLQRMAEERLQTRGLSLAQLEAELGL